MVFLGQESLSESAPQLYLAYRWHTPLHMTSGLSHAWSCCSAHC